MQVETISRVPQPRHVVPLDAAASTPRPLSEPRLVEDALQPHPPPAYSSPAASCHLMSWYVERGRPSGQAAARGADSTAGGRGREAGVGLVVGVRSAGGHRATPWQGLMTELRVQHG